jgi:hypothetical protein
VEQTRQERRRLEREAEKQSGHPQVQPLSELDLGFDMVPPELVDRMIDVMAISDGKTPTPGMVEIATDYARRVQMDYHMFALAMQGRMLMSVYEDGRIVYAVNPDFVEQPALADGANDEG